MGFHPRALSVAVLQAEEELATWEAFNRDPAEVLRWYDNRRAIIAGAEPNQALRALARAEILGRRAAIVTQNVDGLHERVGSRAIIHTATGMGSGLSTH